MSEYQRCGNCANYCEVTKWARMCRIEMEIAGVMPKDYLPDHQCHRPDDWRQR